MAKKVRKQPETLPLEVLMVFVPGDGCFYLVGARRVEGEWTYSDEIPAPEYNLEPFITEGVNNQELVHFDPRAGAAALIPGSEKGLPILLYHRDLTLSIAIDAYQVLAQAIRSDAD